MNPSRFNEIEQKFQEWVLQAQQNPPLSSKRQWALGQLVNEILRSRQLCYPQRGRFPGFYKEIYDEAVQDLLLFVCQNIEKYNPERGAVLTWLNMLLERRFFREAIPKVMGRQDMQRMTLEDLDHLASPDKSQTLTEILEELVELDPGDRFKNEHIEHQPAINFQAVLKRRISGHSWKEIAAEFHSKIPTISSFYYRCLTKFSSSLKEYCIDHK
jgi:DNA-directed RNA polymerase specialized sigma24 family protein